MPDISMFHELVEQTSENTARRVVEELRKDLVLASERIIVLEETTGIKNGNGLKRKVTDLESYNKAREIECLAKHVSVDLKTEAAKKSVELEIEAVKVLSEKRNLTVQRWGWMMMGSAATAGAVGTGIGLLLHFFGLLKT